MNVLLLLLGQCPVGHCDFRQHGGKVDRFIADRDVDRVHHGVRDQLVDHFGQLPGRGADVAELVLDAGERKWLHGGELIEHLGASENDAQRVRSCDRAEHPF
jgi:hypothetical protein